MTTLTLISTILISLALFFYSLGVWSERFNLYLLKWHVFVFWLGFFFDVSGTLAMHKLADGPFNILELHTLTGQIALWLMLIHAAWATWAIKKGSDVVLKKFHKYSLVVWIIWLIPYFGGMYIGMSK